MYAVPSYEWLLERRSSVASVFVKFALMNQILHELTPIHDR